MSNMNQKSHTTKLRGNEMSKRRSQNQFNSGSGLQIDSVASCSSRISNPEITSEPRRNKCGGRGIAIQQLSESIKTSKGITKNSNLGCMNFSNSNIERHFKNLKEENVKKLKEENEKTWGKLIHSNKNT